MHLSRFQSHISDRKRVSINATPVSTLTSLTSQNAVYYENRLHFGIEIIGYSDAIDNLSGEPVNEWTFLVDRIGLIHTQYRCE